KISFFLIEIKFFHERGSFMVTETKIIIRNRSDKEKSIKDAIFAFSGGKKSLLIKGEGEEISTAVEVAEILKNRMYPMLEIGNISLGSRPFFDNKNRRYNNRNTKGNKNKIDLISNIEITLQTKTLI
ncbi:MAG: hypothetical protein ACFE8N_15225, partial [Promethearchaeota archaeon]